MSEDYPGQAYVHKHNANIKRAEEKAMSEKLAGLGEGVKGLVAKWRNEWQGVDFMDKTVQGTLNRCADELETALEAAARLPAPDDYNLAVERCVDFLMREADANFLPNEPLKMLIKGLAIAMRAALATPSPQAGAKT